MDISDIVEKVRREHLWTKSEAARHLSEYVDFLRLASGKEERPSIPVDAIWHAHILHTRRYREDCLALAGRFIDHEPFRDDVGCTPSGPADPRDGNAANCTPPAECSSNNASDQDAVVARIARTGPTDAPAIVAGLPPFPPQPGPRCTSPGPVPAPRPGIPLSR